MAPGDIRPAWGRFFSVWPFSVLAALLGGLASLFVLREGIVLSPDGWEYWEGSINLLMGRGYQYYGGQPIRLYPPLFPTYLAGIQSLTSPSGHGLTIAVAALSALTIAAWVQLFMRLADSPPKFSWTAIWLVLFLVQFVAFSYVALLSETLFLCLLGTALVFTTQLKSRDGTDPLPYRALLGLTLCGCAMLGSRNNAIAFIPCFAGLVWWQLRAHSATSRFIASAATSTIPIGFWIGLRSALGQGSSHRLQVPTLDSLGGYSSDFAQGIPVLLGSPAPGIGVVIALCALGLLLATYCWEPLLERTEEHATRRAILLCLIGSLAGLWIVMASAKVFDAFNGRFIWFVPMATMVLLAASEQRLSSPWQRRAIQLVLACAAVAQLSRFDTSLGPRDVLLLPQQTMAVEYVAGGPRIDPSLEAVRPPRFHWIVRRRGFAL